MGGEWVEKTIGEAPIDIRAYSNKKLEADRKNQILKQILENTVVAQKALEVFSLPITNQYFTSTKKSPCGGAVNPARVRSWAAKIAAKSSTLHAPRPTATNVPIMFRTI